MRRPRRGEIWRADFLRKSGREANKSGRPGVIVSDDAYNENGDRVTILPFTGAFDDNGDRKRREWGVVVHPSQVLNARPSKPALEKESILECDQIRPIFAVSSERRDAGELYNDLWWDGPLGTVPDTITANVDRMLGRLLAHDDDLTLEDQARSRGDVLATGLEDETGEILLLVVSSNRFNQGTRPGLAIAVPLVTNDDGSHLPVVEIVRQGGGVNLDTKMTRVAEFQETALFDLFTVPARRVGRAVNTSDVLFAVSDYLGIAMARKKEPGDPDARAPRDVRSLLTSPGTRARLTRESRKRRNRLGLTLRSLHEETHKRWLEFEGDSAELKETFEVAEPTASVAWDRAVAFAKSIGAAAVNLTDQLGATVFGPIRTRGEIPVRGPGQTQPSTGVSRVFEMSLATNTYSVELRWRDHRILSCDVAGVYTPIREPMRILLTSESGATLFSQLTDVFGNARFDVSLPAQLGIELLRLTATLRDSTHETILMTS